MNAFVLSSFVLLVGAVGVSQGQCGMACELQAACHLLFFYMNTFVLSSFVLLVGAVGVSQGQCGMACVLQAACHSLLQYEHVRIVFFCSLGCCRRSQPRPMRYDMCGRPNCWLGPVTS